MNTNNIQQRCRCVSTATTNSRPWSCRQKDSGYSDSNNCDFYNWGYLLVNIPLPNVDMGFIFDPLPVYKNGLGSVNGYVIGSPEVPIRNNLGCS